MTRSARILLGDFLEAASLARACTQGVGGDKFVNDVEKQDAVLRRLEIIGEVVQKLPAELMKRYPEVPWRDMRELGTS